jgi:hypothetical protein
MSGCGVMDQQASTAGGGLDSKTPERVRLERTNFKMNDRTELAPAARAKGMGRLYQLLVHEWGKVFPIEDQFDIANTTSGA